MCLFWMGQGCKASFLDHLYNPNFEEAHNGFLRDLI